MLNTLSQFDPHSRIETTLCRYELWEKNAISMVEVENFRVRLYEPQEIEALLKEHGFKIINQGLNDETTSLLFECENG